jgi:hypothetical protein
VTLRERFYLTLVVLALLALALGGVLVRWAGFGRPAQQPV